MPRKIIGGAFVSLDGVMQAPGGPDEDRSGGFAHGGWLQPLADDALGHQIDTLFSREFDLLLGRRTYEIFAAYWPFMPATDPIAAKFSKAAKYVLTRSNIALDWRGSHRLPDFDALAKLKSGNGPDLVIQGSSTLYPQLLERGLLDSLVLMMAPITLGKGKRLFGDGTPARSMKLVEQRMSAGGMLMVTYEPAGGVNTGTFETQDPSAIELKRRKRVNAGDW